MERYLDAVSLLLAMGRYINEEASICEFCVVEGLIRTLSAADLAMFYRLPIDTTGWRSKL
jgi:hypothetical protein